MLSTIFNFHKNTVLTEIEKILKKRKLKNTEVRKSVLSVFLQHNYALSHADIEEKLKDVDKVTLYRTLHAFEESGIIHLAQSETDSKQYALCKDDCSLEKHEHNHIHFFCKSCEKTYCIPHEVSLKNGLPKGYITEEVVLLVKGTCSSCNH